MLKKLTGLLLLLLVAGCEQGSMKSHVADVDAAQPKSGGDVVMTISGDPAVLNPAITTSAVDMPLGSLVYESLVRFGPGFTFEPNLAKSWTISADGLTYTFDLVDANWQDGKPFTSDDVKFTLEEVSSKYGPLFAGAGKKIKEIKTLGEHKVEISLNAPYGPFLGSLTNEKNGQILPKHIFEGSDVTKNTASLTAPVGTGPFMLKEWVRGSHLTFEKNPNYWREGRPYLDQVIARIIPVAAQRSLSLRAGEVDYIEAYFLPLGDLATFKGDDRFVMFEAAFPASDVIVVNTKRPPLDKPQVRQALLQAIDRNYLNAAAYFGTGAPAKSAIDSRLSQASDLSLDYDELYPYDVAAANAKLDAAGLEPDASGFRFSIDLLIDAGKPELPQIAETLKQYWGAIGVKVDITGVERTVVFKKLYGDYDYGAALRTYDTGGDPAAGVARLYTTDSIDPSRRFNNASQYSNPEVDALFIKGQDASTVEERGKHYGEAAQILAKDLPVLNYHERAYISARNSRVKNVDLTGYFLWWDQVWVSE